MILRTLFESLARCFITVFVIGMVWTVYSNHNPTALENVWVLRIMAFSLLIWVFLPLFDYFTKHFRKQDSGGKK